ncbi:hypothetical protein [Nitrosomonas sp. Nm166]|uniref:hypothetical protein n=1 Tax=Nitrosomonas sp. Nm166 TaxID=1881054 RepID=UPI00116096B0|nr:hypothetical protein [Nitrosomonas sp. Nm166]
MIKRIQIKDKNTDRFIAEYWIEFKKHFNLSEEDCCNAAWQNAIAEQKVNRNSRSDYQLVIVEDIPTI